MITKNAVRYHCAICYGNDVTIDDFYSIPALKTRYRAESMLKMVSEGEYQATAEQLMAARNTLETNHDV